jgi:hypothetical protein
MRNHEQILRAKVQDLLVRHLSCDTAELDFRRLGSLFSSGKVYRVKGRFLRDGRLMTNGAFLVKLSQYAHLEERWLRLLNSRLDGKAVGNSIPRLVGMIKEESAVVTGYFDGTSNLHQALLRSAVFGNARNGLADVLYRTGNWLGTFQGDAYDGALGLLADEIPDLSHRLSELPWFSETEKARVAEIVAKASNDLGPLPVVISHGDFAPRNVLYTDQDILVIDWEMVPERLRAFLFDVHHFEICLSKRTGGIFRSGHVIDAGGRGFAEGYAASSPFKGLIEPMWRPVRLVVLVTVLSRQFRASRRQPAIAALTGKKKFMLSLSQEIRRQL